MQNTILDQLRLALEYHRAGRLDIAEKAYRQILSIDPNNGDALHLLARIAHSKGQFPQAIELLNRAVALYPSVADLHNSLGSSLRQQGRLEEALASYRRAAQLNSSDVEAAQNCGVALHDLGRVNEAIQVYQQVLASHPDNAQARFNFANALLTSGDFDRGWREYEQRVLSDQFSIRPMSAPRWDGSDLHGRTILLRGEQGIGDTIQFVRYAPMVASRGGRVWVECWPRLAPLIRTAPGVEQVFPDDQPLPRADFQVPLMSLPYIFRTTLQTIPATAAYLHADPQRVLAWRQRLAGLSPGARLKIGIAWTGNPRNNSNRMRSCPLPAFAQLAAQEGVQLFSLQKGIQPDPLSGVKLIDVTPDLRDFLDTAAAMEALDLIISVCTSQAHLAGALGRPVWTLLAFAADWRWLLDRQDSPWYPTMRLFRQTTPGDWGSVMRQIAEEIAGTRNS